MPHQQRITNYTDPFYQKFKTILEYLRKNNKQNDLDTFNETIEFLRKKNQWVGNKYSLSQKFSEFFVAFLNSELIYLKLICAETNSYGVFAKVDISAEQKIIGLIGYRNFRALSRNSEIDIGKKSSKFRKSYGDNVAFDGPMYFLNSRCNPNLRTIQTNQSFYVKSTRRILKDEELSIFYGKQYFKARDLACNCLDCQNQISKRRQLKFNDA